MSSKPQHPGPLLAAALIAVAAVAVAFYFKPFPALEDKSLLLSDATVRVVRGGAGLSFLPLAGAKSTGLVFYGGERVPPEAYAYLARACAQAGYTAVISSMPLNFPALAPSRAAEAARDNPNVLRWVLGGHSLGGTTAASYVARTSKRREGARVEGLLLLASFPRGGADLSTKSLHVVTVGASRDALASPAAIAAAGQRLPAASRLIEIAGGNHSQFGEYGPQPGDGLAEIPGPTQREAVVEEAVGLLAVVEAGAGK
jgi:hypothetical protein